MSRSSAESDDGFARFAVASRARLRRTAYLMCGDWERASDHVQEALIRVYANWSRLERRGNELAYARRAVVSVVIDSSRRRSSREQPVEADASAPSGEDVAAEVTERLALHQALARLPARQRACVVLRYVEDLDVRATAAALGCREGTVKSQTARGLSTLRTLLGDLAAADVTDQRAPDDTPTHVPASWRHS